jgi:hypothetical protein
MHLRKNRKSDHVSIPAHKLTSRVGQPKGDISERKQSLEKVADSHTMKARCSPSIERLNIGIVESVEAISYRIGEIVSSSTLLKSRLKCSDVIRQNELLMCR